ncbi:MAG: Holliday junction branch migration protein RuvA [Acidimicrobiia bacterium]|nr:Holliday junction branch migration protein RuvA [Acidimicrobiia bacterium]
MIGSLRGRVLDRDPVIDRSALPEVIVEVAGVGYRITVTVATLDRLGLDDEVLLHIHHHIRESDQKLYGFLVKDERVAFEGLLAAHGVGPALAMAVLSTHSAPELARILADDDLAALCEVPGVGKKTAQRLLVELKSSLVLPETGPGIAIDLNGGTPIGATPAADVREALVNLGYSGEEVRVALAALPSELLEDPAGDSGQLLKVALRALAGS